MLDVIFDLLKHKIASFHDCEMEVMLAADEMAIVDGKQFDPSTQSEIGSITVPLFKSTNEPNATKALVFMIGGISTRWKQTVAYFLTGNSIHPEAFKNISFEIIQKCESIGLRVNSGTTDMGPCNQRLWRDLGVRASKNDQAVNFIEHPCDRNRKLYFFADVPHLFKNATQGFLNKDTIYFSDAIVKKYNLKANYASVVPIKEFFNAQKNDALMMTPKLGQKNLDPNHFAKMKVMTSSSVISNDVAATLEYLYATDNGDVSFETTSWFVHTLRKWFDIMSSRHQSIAISQQNISKYNETISFLRDVIDTFYNINMGSTDGRWTPF